MLWKVAGEKVGRMTKTGYRKPLNVMNTQWIYADWTSNIIEKK